MTPMLDDFIHDAEQVGFTVVDVDEDDTGLIIDDSKPLSDWIDLITKLCNTYGLTHDPMQLSQDLDVFVCRDDENWEHFCMQRGLFTVKDFILEHFPDQTEVFFVETPGKLREEYRMFCFQGCDTARQLIAKDNLDTKEEKEAERFLKAFAEIKKRVTKKNHRVFTMRNRFEIVNSLPSRELHTIELYKQAYKLGYCFGCEEFV